MKFNLWFQVFDSYGRFSSGFLNGENFFLGDYQECNSIQNKQWNSKYCILDKMNTQEFRLVIIYE